MKKLIVTFIACCLIVPAYAIVIGKVDVQQVMQEIKEGQSAKIKLEKIFAKKQKELKKEEGRIKKIHEDYQKQSMVMNDKAKMKKEQQIQKAMRDFQNKTMTYQREIQELEQKLMAPILKKVKGIVTEVSKEAKVDVTFQSGSGPVIYAKSSRDLTMDVVKKFNKKYPGK